MADTMDKMYNALVVSVAALGSASTQELKFNQTTIDLVNSVWGYFALIGIGLTLIYFLIEMNRKYALEGRDMTLKTAFLPFLKLMIAIAVIANGGNIVGILIGLHNTIVQGVTDTLVIDGAMDILGGSNAFDVGFIEKIILILGLVGCLVVTLVVRLAWSYKAILFKVEYLYRIAITPIALGDIYSGNNSTAMRWLKSFLALALYAIAFIILPQVATKLAFKGATVTITDPLSLLGALASLLVAPIAALGCLSAAKQAANQALGV